MHIPPFVLKAGADGVLRLEGLFIKLFRERLVQCPW